MSKVTPTTIDNFIAEYEYAYLPWQLKTEIDVLRDEVECAVIASSSVLITDYQSNHQWSVKGKQTHLDEMSLTIKVTREQFVFEKELVKKRMLIP